MECGVPCGYNYRCDYKGDYHMWQSTSTGTVSGIGTNVDLNFKIVLWYVNAYHTAAVSSSGKVTAKGVGKATITAKSSNGKKAACKVTVRPKTNKIKKLKKSGKKSIKITWSKVSGTTKYQIYMSKKKSSGYKRIKTASSKSASYTKKSLKRGRRYYFKVRSYKTVGTIQKIKCVILRLFFFVVSGLLSNVSLRHW